MDCNSNDFVKVEKDGITFLACGKYNEGNFRYVSHLLKEGDRDGIEYAAEKMARIIPKGNSVLVPIPGHTGRSIQTLDLTKAISSRTSLPVFDVLRGNSRESLYYAKQDGRTLSDKELGFRKIKSLPSGYTPILIDNVADYGITGRSAVNALGSGIVLTFSLTDNILTNKNSIEENISRSFRR